MSEFNEMLSKAGKEKPAPNISGEFECQTCFVSVIDAYYDAQRQRLSWDCPDGHQSKIEEFRL